MTAHTFNPSTREVETESDVAGQRKEYAAGGNRSSDIQSEGFIIKTN